MRSRTHRTTWRPASSLLRKTRRRVQAGFRARCRSSARPRFRSRSSDSAPVQVSCANNTLPTGRIVSIACVEARGIHHLGVAVQDLDEALETYERLFGAELEHRATVSDQGVEAVAVRIGGGRVELLSPLEDDTPVGRFLASRGPGMHHVAFEVEDIRRRARLAEARRCGARRRRAARRHVRPAGRLCPS